jgi:hypothetical protein
MRVSDLSNNMKALILDPNRTVPYYIDKELICINCNKLYTPAKNSDINEILKVPTILVNNFCSRKCFEEFSNKLNINEYKKNI